MRRRTSAEPDPFQNLFSVSRDCRNPSTTNHQVGARLQDFRSGSEIEQLRQSSVLRKFEDVLKVGRENVVGLVQA